MKAFPPGKRAGNKLARIGGREQISKSFKNFQTPCKSCHIRRGSSSNSVTEYVSLNIPVFAMSSTVISVQMCTNGKKDSVICIFDC